MKRSRITLITAYGELYRVRLSCGHTYHVTRWELHNLRWSAGKAIDCFKCKLRLKKGKL